MSVLACVIRWSLLDRTHESPVLEGKALLEGVKWQVAARALGVVVRAGELGASGLEAAAGDEGWGRCGAESSTSEHLGRLVKVAIGAELEHTLAVLWRGDVAELSRGGSMRAASLPTRTCLGSKGLCVLLF